MNRLSPNYDEGMSVWFGDTELSLENAAAYCAFEYNFLRQISYLEAGVRGAREEYYRTLLKMGVEASGEKFDELFDLVSLK